MSTFYTIDGKAVEMTEQEVAEWEEVQRKYSVVSSVPDSISPLQARNALRKWGVTKNDLEGFFNTISDPVERESAQDSWEYATTIERDNPLILQCAKYLGKTEEDVDQFFVDASRG